MKPQFVVAVGNAFDGLTLYGPFNSEEAALNWADIGCRAEQWDIVRLNTADDESK